MSRSGSLALADPASTSCAWPWRWLLSSPLSARQFSPALLLLLQTCVQASLFILFPPLAGLICIVWRSAELVAVAGRHIRRARRRGRNRCYLRRCHLFPGAFGAAFRREYLDSAWPTWPPLVGLQSAVSLPLAFIRVAPARPIIAAVILFTLAIFRRRGLVIRGAPRRDTSASPKCRRLWLRRPQPIRLPLRPEHLRPDRSTSRSSATFQT